MRRDPFVLGLIALLVILGCGASAATVAQDIQLVTMYEAAQIACIDQAANRAQADDCRATVKLQYCGPGGALSDAGACSWEASAPPPAAVTPPAIIVTPPAATVAPATQPIQDAGGQ